MSRREWLFKALQFALAAALCHAVAWVLDGNEPVVTRFRNGVGLADVADMVAGLGATAFGLLTFLTLVAAAAGRRDWVIVGD